MKRCSFAAFCAFLIVAASGAHAEKIIIIQRGSNEPSISPSTDTPAVQTPQTPTPPTSNAIKLRGLNKVTARVSELEGLLGTVMRFGDLEIIAHRCWQAPVDEQPESAGLLEIWQLEQSEEPQRIFSGWMFASSPALSALEDPVYDITVIGCTTLPTGE